MTLAEYYKEIEILNTEFNVLQDRNMKDLILAKIDAIYKVVHEVDIKRRVELAIFDSELCKIPA